MNSYRWLVHHHHVLRFIMTSFMLSSLVSVFVTIGGVLSILFKWVLGIHRAPADRHECSIISFSSALSRSGLSPAEMIKLKSRHYLIIPHAHLSRHHTKMPEFLSLYPLSAPRMSLRLRDMTLYRL
ncbi:hypothetical protein P692DRAFT_20540120 [Suillus brevipes Sb2]|nr:hypothetical protein P692DRAFT_20540120 [Suillus brevipes Sb2]